MQIWDNATHVEISGPHNKETCDLGHSLCYNHSIIAKNICLYKHFSVKPLLTNPENAASSVLYVTGYLVKQQTISLQSFPVFMPSRVNHPVAATSYSLSLCSFVLTVTKQLQQTNISSALPNITKTTTGSECVCYYRTMSHSLNHVAASQGDQMQPCKPLAASVSVADDWWDQEPFSHHSVKMLPAS